jgi:hypothetical protein
MRGDAVAAAALALLVGCGSSNSNRVEEEFVRGVEQIRGASGAHELHDRLVRTIASLRREPASTGAVQRGRRLAIQGFASTLRGVDAQIDLIENDSGKLEAAARDAAKADRYRKRGANLLRSAGRAFGISVGQVGGY